MASDEAVTRRLPPRCRGDRATVRRSSAGVPDARVSTSVQADRGMSSGYREHRQEPLAYALEELGSRSPSTRTSRRRRRGNAANRGASPTADTELGPRDERAKAPPTTQLRAVRSAWWRCATGGGSPDGGLVDLMAAARAKAAGPMHAQPTHRQRVPRGSAASRHRVATLVGLWRRGFSWSAAAASVRSYDSGAGPSGCGPRWRAGAGRTTGWQSRRSCVDEQVRSNELESPAPGKPRRPAGSGTAAAPMGERCA